MKPKESRCCLRKASPCSVDIVGCGNSRVVVFLDPYLCRLLQLTEVCEQEHNCATSQTESREIGPTFGIMSAKLMHLKVFHAGPSTIGLTRKHGGRNARVIMQASVRFHVCEILILKMSLLMLSV